MATITHRHLLLLLVVALIGAACGGSVAADEAAAQAVVTEAATTPTSPSPSTPPPTTAPPIRTAAIAPPIWTAATTSTVATAATVPPTTQAPDPEPDARPVPVRLTVDEFVEGLAAAMTAQLESVDDPSQFEGLIISEPDEVADRDGERILNYELMPNKSLVLLLTVDNDTNLIRTYSFLANPLAAPAGQGTLLFGVRNIVLAETLKLLFAGDDEARTRFVETLVSNAPGSDVSANKLSTFTEIEGLWVFWGANAVLTLAYEKPESS